MEPSPRFVSSGRYFDTMTEGGRATTRVGRVGFARDRAGQPSGPFGREGPPSLATWVCRGCSVSEWLKFDGTEAAGGGAAGTSQPGVVAVVVAVGRVRASSPEFPIVRTGTSTGLRNNGEP